MYFEYNPGELGLKNHIENRGHLWKALVSGSPVPRKYEGPAIELEPGLMLNFVRGDRVNVSSLSIPW